MSLPGFRHGLWRPDEPRVAGVCAEMARSYDFCVPHLNGRPFLEKPPLYFATVGLFYHILGTHPEGMGRLASVVFSLGTLAVVFLGIRTLMGEEVSGLSTLILATSFLFFLTSHKMLVDNALVFFTTSALVSFMLGYKEKSSWGFKLFWVCLSLAFMTKGAVGIGIPIIAVVSFMLWKMDFSVLKKMWLVPGVFLVAAIMSVWGLSFTQRAALSF